MNLFTEGYMKNQLNKTVTVLQKLTNKISDIKEKTDDFLVEQDYLILQNKINDLQLLINNVRNVTINVENLTNPLTCPSIYINGIQYMIYTGPGIYKEPEHTNVIQIYTTYPITLEFNGFYFQYIKITDKNNTQIYEITNGEKHILQSGPDYIYMNSKMHPGNGSGQ